MVRFGYIARLPELWDAYRHAFRTDVDTAQVPGFTLLARQMDLRRIDSFTLGPATYAGIAENGELILLPNQDEVYAILDDFLADPRFREEGSVVAIRHAPGAEAAAAAVRQHLIGYGVPPGSLRLLARDGPRRESMTSPASRTAGRSSHHWWTFACSTRG